MEKLTLRAGFTSGQELSAGVELVRSRGRGLECRLKLHQQSKIHGTHLDRRQRTRNPRFDAPRHKSRVAHPFLRHFELTSNVCAPGPGLPSIGLRRWGGDLDFETWESNDPFPSGLIPSDRRESRYLQLLFAMPTQHNMCAPSLRSLIAQGWEPQPLAQPLLALALAPTLSKTTPSPLFRATRSHNDENSTTGGCPTSADTPSSTQNGGPYHPPLEIGVSKKSQPASPISPLYLPQLHR